MSPYLYEESCQWLRKVDQGLYGPENPGTCGRQVQLRHTVKDLTQSTYFVEDINDANLKSSPFKPVNMCDTYLQSTIEFWKEFRIEGSIDCSGSSILHLHPILGQSLLHAYIFETKHSCPSWSEDFPLQMTGTLTPTLHGILSCAQVQVSLACPLTAFFPKVQILLWHFCIGRCSDYRVNYQWIFIKEGRRGTHRLRESLRSSLDINLISWKQIWLSTKLPHQEKGKIL